MAGSTMDDRSWAALGCWTCLRYWIWVCRIKQTGVSDRKSVEVLYIFMNTSPLASPVMKSHIKMYLDIR